MREAVTNYLEPKRDIHIYHDSVNPMDIGKKNNDDDDERSIFITHHYLPILHHRSHHHHNFPSSTKTSLDIPSLPLINEVKC